MRHVTTPHHFRLFRSSVASRARKTWTSRSSFAACATPTSTRSATNGPALPIRSCRGTRSSGVWSASGREVSRIQGGRPGRRWGAWSIRAAPAPTARRAWSSTATPALTFTYNSPDKILGGMTYGGYSERIVVDQDFVLQPVRQARPGGGGAAALRRHHDVFAAAPLGRVRRTEGRRSSGSAVSGTWGSSSPTRSARTWCSSPPRRARRRTRKRLGAARGGRLEERR